MHYIYVLAGRDLRTQADMWATVKTMNGKEYKVIKARVDETPNGKLTVIGTDDVLYIYAHMWMDPGDKNVPTGRVGESQKDANQLALHLKNEGLALDHIPLKIYACRSADPIKDSDISFVQSLFDAMRNAAVGYTQIEVYGYKGETNPLAPGAPQKTAGLDNGEVAQMISKAEWEMRGLRAKDQRVKIDG